MITSPSPPSHLILLSDHVLGHFKGAEVLVHVLDVRVVRGVLASVQQPLDGGAVVVDHAALVLNFVPRAVLHTCQAWS